jgi:isopenicillin N synthase-like dioxygenase
MSWTKLGVRGLDATSGETGRRLVATPSSSSLKTGKLAMPRDESAGSVPNIDMTPYFSGNEDAKQRVADQIGAACREFGFLTITGHRVPEALIEEVYRNAKRFFDMPIEIKRAIHQPASDIVRGYSAVGEEGLSYSLDRASPGDLKESLTIGPVETSATDPYFSDPEAGHFFAPNLWPDQPPGLKSSWCSYFGEMETLSKTLMRLFARALALEETYFDDKIDKHISNFRAINYPDQPKPPEVMQLRAGAHSDYGSLTIVRQDDAPGGLQVERPDGSWVDVAPRRNAFVVNIGDLMQQWTNDAWRSTMHRVVNPPRSLALGSRRLSLVFFHQPNYDAVVSCLPTCQDPENPARHAPVTSGRHFIGKFVKQVTMGAAT